MKTVKNLALVLAAATLLSSCADDKKLDLPGERISVLSHDTSLHISASDKKEIRITAVHSLPSWDMAGGNASHNLQNVKLVSNPKDLQEIWSLSIGSGSDGSIAEPVVFGSVIYTVDSKGEVNAFALSSAEKLWNVNIADTIGKKGSGTGLAFYKDKLYVVLNSGAVVCISALDGSLIWQKDLGKGIRSAPTAFADKLFIISMDNNLFALSADDGKTVWTYETPMEDTILLGASAPSGKDNTVIAAFSGGDLFAFRAQNGIPVWSDTLFALGRNSFVSGLSSIKAPTVIDKGKVFAVSGEGELAALNFSTGERYWQQSIGSMNQPWVAGDFLFVLSSSSEVICLNKENGSIIWITQLQNWENEEKKKDKIVWNGPVMANGNLYFTSSLGDLTVLDKSGKIIFSERVSGSFYTNPIIVEDTLLLLDNSGTLRAFK